MATDKDLQKDLEAIRADIAALTDSIGRLGGDMSDLRATMRQTVNDAAKDAVDAGEEILSEAMKLGSDAADTAADAARATKSSLEAEIKRNPISAVLIALGVGFVIGAIGRR